MLEGFSPLTRGLLVGAQIPAQAWLVYLLYQLWRRDQLEALALLRAGDPRGLERARVAHGWACWALAALLAIGRRLFLVWSTGEPEPSLSDLYDFLDRGLAPVVLLVFQLAGALFLRGGARSRP